MRLVAFSLPRRLGCPSPLISATDQGIVKTAASIFEFHCEDMKHKPVDLAQYKGKVCLVTNVAGL